MPIAIEAAAVAVISKAANSTGSTGNLPSWVVAEWDKVNQCEEGGKWGIQGPVFSGGLGISNHNWIAYGGGRYAPNAGLATPYQQILIAQRIQPQPPDQNGTCSGW